MFTIHLANLKFFARHGVHNEERVLGGAYEINATVTFKENKRITDLQQTVNYAIIYDIIRQRMQKPAALLETVVQDLADSIYTLDNRIASIDINLKKMHPPIEAFEGSISVSYKKDF
jgi:7,8-dihydroneopterin aldolase/epimerase/oxygenase